MTTTSASTHSSESTAADRRGTRTAHARLLGEVVSLLKRSGFPHAGVSPTSGMLTLAAFGQRSVDATLVADDREAPALARIRELHAEGKSLRAIAATLTEEGHKPKRSDRWHPQTLAKIVARFDTTKAPA